MLSACMMFVSNASSLVAMGRWYWGCGICQIQTLTALLCAVGSSSHSCSATSFHMLCLLPVAAAALDGWEVLAKLAGYRPRRQCCCHVCRAAPGVMLHAFSMLWLSLLLLCRGHLVV
jgi:hypothetical protein